MQNILKCLLEIQIISKHYRTANVGHSIESMNGLAETFPLDQLVLANQLWITLNVSDGQTSPYFEVRGCDLEGNVFKKKNPFFPISKFL